jgi:hypothetical protein
MPYVCMGLKGLSSETDLSFVEMYGVDQSCKKCRGWCFSFPDDPPICNKLW